jgi:alkylation response protein AidB-like acyl-CoA dehydrogenase
VAGALVADLLLVPVGGQLLCVDASAADRRAVPSLDMTRPLADVVFDGCPATVLAQGEPAESALRRAQDVAAALLASEQLGLAERCLEMAVAHLLQRRQFGRVLGSYQALKHRLADVWTEVSRARAVARYAASCAASTAEDLPVAASLAQAVCAPVAQHAAEECVQLLGGIGFTWEHPAHLYLKRARSDSLALGSPRWHRRRLGDLVDLPAQPTPSTRGDG